MAKSLEIIIVFTSLPLANYGWIGNFSYSRYGTLDTMSTSSSRDPLSLLLWPVRMKFSFDFEHLNSLS